LELVGHRTDATSDSLQISYFLEDFGGCGERQTDRHRQRVRETDTDTDRETGRDRDRHRQRDVLQDALVRCLV